MDHYIVLCDDQIIITTSDSVSSFYKPYPIQMFRIACVLSDSIYVVSGDYSQTFLRKIELKDGNVENNHVVIVIPDKKNIIDMFFISDMDLVLVCTNSVMSLKLDSHGFVSILEEFFIMPDEQMDIESITYQDGFYYVLTHKWHDDDVQDSCDNFIFVFNDLWEYQQVFMLPIHTKCTQIRYVNHHIMFANLHQLYKFNIVTKEAFVFETFDFNITSYGINQERHIMCLVSNTNNGLPCGVVDVSSSRDKNTVFQHLSGILHTCSRLLCMNDVSSPASRYKRSFIKKIYYPDPHITVLVEKLRHIYDSFEKVQTSFAYRKAENTCEETSYKSIDEFLSGSHVKNTQELCISFPSWEGKYPLQLIDYKKYTLTQDLYDHCITHSLNPTGWFVYPKDHNMGWHTNLDNIEHEIVKHRLYIALNKAPFGSSFFLYIHPISKEVHIVPDLGINIICFSLLCEDKKPLWHAVMCTDGLRMSFGLGQDNEFSNYNHQNC